MTTESAIQDIPFPGMPEPGPALPPAGIAQLPEHCWHLVDEDGTPRDNGDMIPHYATESQAKTEAADIADYRADNDLDPKPLTPAQLPERCWTASSACGKDLGDELDGGGHFPSASLALQQARECDWRVIDGELRCDDLDMCRARR